MSLTEVLAERVAEDVPSAAALHAARRCVVDWAGCAVAGSQHEAIEAFERGIGVLGSDESCAVVGRTSRRPAAAAALLNGAAAHVLDIDDVNTTMIGHPAVVVVPAALAVAEDADADVETLLVAVVAGYEVAAALGHMGNPEHYEAGWHATATYGAIAAAAAAARVLGLDAGATARALSLAATQAAGLRLMFGTHGKSFHAGRAAMAGVLAASFAEAGAEVPTEVIAGSRGLLRLTGTGPEERDVAAAVSSNGHAAILDTAFKRHAACGATHALADAIDGLVADNGIAAGEIGTITARVHTLAVEAAGIPDPTTGLEAKFSLRHVAAMAAHWHPLGSDRFEDGEFAPPEVVALRGRVIVEADPEMEYLQAMPADVTIKMEDGRSFQRLVEIPIGRPKNPLSDSQLEDKAVALAGPVLGEDRARAAVAKIWDERASRPARELGAGLAA